MQATTQTKP